MLDHRRQRHRQGAASSLTEVIRGLELLDDDLSTGIGQRLEDAVDALTAGPILLHLPNYTSRPDSYQEVTGAMSKLRCHISISLDGFVAGANQTQEKPSMRAASCFTSGSPRWPLAPIPRPRRGRGEPDARIVEESTRTSAPA